MDRIKLGLWQSSAVNLKNEYSRLPKSIKRLSILVFIYVFGWSLSSPFTSIYFQSVLKELKYVGLVTAFLPLFGMIIALPLGELSDNLSKRVLIRWSLLLYAPFSFVFLSLRNLFHFVLFRLYHGTIATSLWVGFDSYQRCHAPKHKEISTAAIYDFAVNGALVLGALLSGFLFMVLQFKIFYFISIFSLIALIYTFWLPDHDKKVSVKDGFLKVIHKKGFLKKEIKLWWKSKDLKKTQFFQFWLRFSLAFFQMLLPIFLKFNNATPVEIGLIYALFYVPLLFEPVLSLVVKKSYLFRLFMLISSVMFFVLYFVKSIPAILISTVLLAISFSGLLPVINGTITSYMKKGHTGEMTGVTMFITNLAAMLGPLIGGYLADWKGIQAVFVIGGVITFGLLLMTFVKMFKITLFKEENV